MFLSQGWGGVHMTLKTVMTSSRLEHWVPAVTDWFRGPTWPSKRLPWDFGGQTLFGEVSRVPF